MLMKRLVGCLRFASKISLPLLLVSCVVPLVIWWLTFNVYWHPLSFQIFVACVISLFTENIIILLIWKANDTNRLCAFYREYKQTDICIDDLIGQCNAYDQFYYKAVEDSWDYICEDKKAGMFLCIKNGICFILV